VIPSWNEDETFLSTAHQRLRILAIDFDLADELAERGVNAVFTSRQPDEEALFEQF
jgi:uroporphyrinogen-III synthase